MFSILAITQGLRTSFMLIVEEASQIGGYMRLGRHKYASQRRALHEGPEAYGDIWSYGRSLASTVFDGVQSAHVMELSQTLKFF